MSAILQPALPGTWTELTSSASCPSCARNGVSSRLTHYAVAEGDLSIFQARCHYCKGVATRINDTSPKALAALRKAHRAGRALVFGVVLGGVFAIGAMAATASALAAMR